MMPAPRLNFCDVWKKVFFFFFISRFMIFPCNIVEDIRNWRCDRVEDGIDIPHDSTPHRLQVIFVPLVLYIFSTMI